MINGPNWNNNYSGENSLIISNDAKVLESIEFIFD